MAMTRRWPIIPEKTSGPGSWAHRAACRGKWSLFDPPAEGQAHTSPEFRERVRAAKYICETCPVLAECAHWRDEQPNAVLGGVVAGRVYWAPRAV